MNYDETHYCSYTQRKISEMKMCSVQKRDFARHKRVRKIQHECYFMKLTHDVFSIQQSVNVCLIARFRSSDSFRFDISCKRLMLNFER